MRAVTMYALFGTDARVLGGRVPARSANDLFSAEMIFDHDHPLTRDTRHTGTNDEPDKQ